MTLLLRGLCVVGTLRKAKEVARALRLIIAAWILFCVSLALAHSILLELLHRLLGCWRAHGSAPSKFGNGAFLGALDILGFWDAGAALTGMPGAELEDAD